MKQCFKPIQASHPKLLVLGTMPSEVSIEQGEYYAHPRNAFWPILTSFFKAPLQSMAENKALCEQQGVMIWDVLAECERKGSLDSAIKQASVNQFDSLFQANPSLEYVIFNGKAAEAFFKKKVLKNQAIPGYITFFCLPSTSPANAQLTLESKRVVWHETLHKVFGNTVE